MLMKRMKGQIDLVDKIANFRQCLDSNGLRDLGFTSSWFTWAVDGKDYGCIRARLDKAMAKIA